MKHLRKVMALVLAAFVALVVAAPAFAQNVNGTQVSGKGQIIVDNASKGETYTAYMLFEATLGEKGEVAYKGTVPSALSTYFVETSTGSGYVQATKSAFSTIKYYTDATKTTESETETDFWTGEGMSDGLKSALKTWAEGQSSNAGSAESDGTKLYFNNLTYGYYVVTTTQGEMLVSVDTAKPSANIIDKNSTTITAQKKVNGEDEVSASIGETVTFTATFATTNYIGDEQVKSYTISDTLPEYLTDVAITSVKVIETPAQEAKEDDPATTDIDESAPAVDEVSTDLSSSYTAFTNKKIIIPWVAEDDTTSLYKNGSTIEIQYTAKITDKAVIDGDGNTNTVDIQPNKDRPGDEPFEEHEHDDANVKTYGAALVKVDETGASLKGAEFTIKGLTVVADASGEAGVYRVVSYSSSSTTPSITLTTNDDGELYILGLQEDVELEVTETKAPDGYNRLTTTATLEPQILSEAIWTKTEDRYFDAKGNLVSESISEEFNQRVTKNYTDLEPNAIRIENNKGIELPSTGGMGTTILYTIGGIMLVGGAIALVSKKRVANMEK